MMMAQEDGWMDWFKFFVFVHAIIIFQEEYDGHKYIFNCQHGENECLGNMIEVQLQMKSTAFLVWW